MYTNTQHGYWEYRVLYKYIENDSKVITVPETQIFRELSNWIVELSDWIKELFNSNTELSNSIRELSKSVMDK